MSNTSPSTDLIEKKNSKKKTTYLFFLLVHRKMTTEKIDEDELDRRVIAAGWGDYCSRAALSRALSYTPPPRAYADRHRPVWTLPEAHIPITLPSVFPNSIRTQ